MKHFLIVISMLISSSVFAHGEDRLGPHAGYISMPGAFHTELVPDGTHKVKVYLLDIDWKDPTVLNSSIELSFKGKKGARAVCKAEGDYFQCNFAKAVNLTKKGELSVVASRKDQKGMEVFYELPFKIKTVGDEHSGHH